MKEIEKLIKLWDKFDEETLEQRKMKYSLDNGGEEDRYFAPKFSDFIDWLKTKIRL